MKKIALIYLSRIKNKKQHYFFLFISLIIAFILWLWSLQGAKTRVKIIRQQASLKIFFDNKEVASAKEKFLEKKKLFIVASKQDLNSLYFTRSTQIKPAVINLPSGDYDLTVTIHNPYAILFHFQGNHPYTFSLGPYRHLSAAWIDEYNNLEKTNAQRVAISLTNGLRWLLWLILRPFPYIALLIAGLSLFFIKKKTKSKSVSTVILFILPISIALASFFWSRYLMKSYLLDIPHVPDAVEYLIIAKMITSGRLVIPINEIPSFIPREQLADYFYHWFKFKDNYMFVPYLLGHPIALAVGQLIGRMQIIPPLIGALTLLLIFYITYKLTQSIFFSMTAMLLCALSPFFQTQTIDFMSHNTAGLYLLLSILPLVNHSKKVYLISGLSLGLLLNTRPLTFAIVALILILWLAKNIKHQKQINLTYHLWFFFGILLPIILFCYYNYLTTGNLLTTPYLYHGIISKIGLGEEYSLGFGLLQGISNLTVFSLFFLKDYHLSFGPLLLSFFLLPFLEKQPRQALIHLQLIVVGIWTIWMLYDGNFFMYGPRFIYESVPPLTILYGTTAFYLWKLINNQRLLKIVLTIIFGLYLARIVFFELQWLGIKPADYQDIIYVPSNINELKNFNGVTGRFIRLYEENKGRKKIFLIRDCGSWQCTGEAVWYNDFPLEKSHPLFLILSKNISDILPQAEIIQYFNYLFD